MARRASLRLLASFSRQDKSMATIRNRHQRWPKLSVLSAEQITSQQDKALQVLAARARSGEGERPASDAAAPQATGSVA